MRKSALAETRYFTEADLPTGSMSEMKKSLNKIFAMLPDKTVIYPGHGEATDAEFEKKNNPYL